MENNRLKSIQILKEEGYKRKGHNCMSKKHERYAMCSCGCFTYITATKMENEKEFVKCNWCPVSFVIQ